MSENSALFSFYYELADFLNDKSGNMNRQYDFKGNPSVKDAIEAQGIPHTEVDLIVVNGISVDFSYNLQHGDTIYVYPASGNDFKGEKVILRGEPDYKFLLDVHLGKLTRLMRLAGFDCLYRNDYDDHQIARMAESLGRIVITRDRRLLRFSSITHGYWVRSHNPGEQLEEVIIRYDLYDMIDPFNRCLECNGDIGPVEKDKVLQYLEPKTILYFNDFYQCGDCGKVYWKGSHFEQMNSFLEKLKNSL